MQSFPSYIEDTTDFINKVRNLKLNKDTYLVTLDVSSLYTNIPHNEGIESCIYFLQKDKGNNNIKANDIRKLLNIVLHNNCFDFNDQSYLQTMGTAMGSPMAPSYASLFMGRLEEQFLNSTYVKPDVWLRFLDDIFMIWNDSLETLNFFIDSLNSFHPNIKFTYNISKSSVPFLDVSVSKDVTGKIVTDIFCKPTNMHLYLDFTSSHPLSCKRGIPFSQAKRYRRVISDDGTFMQSLDTLNRYFSDRNYPKSIIEKAFSKIEGMSQNDALSPVVKNTSSIIPFTVCFNTSLPNIGEILNKYWDLLLLSDKVSVKNIHTKFKPILAYRRPKNIRDYLMRSALLDRTFLSSQCLRSRCSHCNNIIVGSQFNSSITGSSFDLHNDVNCTTRNVIYLITCKGCKKQYVGQTNQNVSCRMNKHRFDIRNCDVNPVSHVAIHFGSNDNKCSLSDFSFLPIEIIDNNMDRLCKESFWIHKLNTMIPNGLNNKVLFDL